MPGEMPNLNLIESISMTFGLGMFGSLLIVVLEKKHPHQRIKKTKKIEVDPKQIDWKHRTGGTVRMEISPSKPPR